MQDTWEWPTDLLNEGALPAHVCSWQTLRPTTKFAEDELTAVIQRMEDIGTSPTARYAHHSTVLRRELRSLAA